MTGSTHGNTSKRFLRAFTTLTQRHQHLRNREVVFKVVVTGTGTVMIALLLLLLISFGLLHNTYVLGRIIVCIGAILYLGVIFYLSRTRYFQLASFLLVGFYMVLAIGMVWQWGINTPFGVLFLGLGIVLASTLLAAKHALVAALISSIAVVGVQLAQNAGWEISDQSWSSHDATIGDALGYCTVFGILALISWLFGRQTERSLVQAEEAEAALRHERDLLEVRVRERTAELRKAQVEEMQHLYQFAEVGQLSTTLLHDLANHLTVLTLEIEGIRSRKHDDAVKRAQHIISHLDALVDGVRDRLKGNSNVQPFTIPEVIDDVVQFIRYKHVHTSVDIVWEVPQNSQEFHYQGDPLRLNQVITILLTNAVDAYSTATKNTAAAVHIQLKQTAAHFIIHIVDHGKGISPARRKKLFKPQESTKPGGMGIGLFLARQMIENNFAGTLTLDDATDQTDFVISIPRVPNEQR
jgi:signal transduction histidine kinase